MLFTLSGEQVFAKDLPGYSGRNEWTWDLKNAVGKDVASGLYVYVLQVEGPKPTLRKGKVVILR